MAGRLSPSLAQAEAREARATIQSVRTIARKRRKNVNRALCAAMKTLEDLQQNQHVNEHGLNEMSKRLKDVYDARLARRSEIRHTVVAEIAARDAAVLWSVPADVPALCPEFLRSVLRIRTKLEREPIPLPNNASEWADDLFAYFCNDADLDCPELMCELVLAVADTKKELVPAILDALDDNDLLHELATATPLSAALVPIFPRAIEWLHPTPCCCHICERKEEECESSALQKLAVAHARPSDWESAAFRKAVAAKERQ
jgi:hypothetical protein